MEKFFQDKVAIVTGGSFGIGRAAAIAFAERGAKVVIADWVEDNETLNAIKSAGGDAIFSKCDVSSDESVRTNGGQNYCTIRKAGLCLQQCRSGGSFCTHARMH